MSRRQDALSPFHAVVRDWFEGAFEAPTCARRALGRPPIAARRSTLLLAPTGSGRTLAPTGSGRTLATIDRLAGVAAAARGFGELRALSPGDPDRAARVRGLEAHVAALRPETAVLYMSGYTDDALGAAGPARPRHALPRHALRAGGPPAQGPRRRRPLGRRRRACGHRPGRCRPGPLTRPAGPSRSHGSASRRATPRADPAGPVRYPSGCATVPVSRSLI